MKWPGGLDVTFSQRVAVSRGAKIFYSLLFLLTLPLLLWFFIAWFVPELKLNNAFVWFASIAILFQIACTWFPEEGGVKTIIHRVLTGISGVALLPLVIIIGLSPHPSSVAKNVAWVSLCCMSFLLAIALANQKRYRWALLLQLGYYSLFFVTILTATYL